MVQSRFSYFSLVLLVIIGVSVSLFIPYDDNSAYAIDYDQLQWEGDFICNNAKEILEKQDKSFEQLVWISKDVREREDFVSNLTENEIEMILSCVKDKTLPDSKSEIVTKKIGFFEGKNDHLATGVARIITIENRDYLRFEHFEIGFSGTTNPDLHVYLTMGDDFSDNVYLEKLKTKVGSKNYPLGSGMDFDTVLIYDELSKEIFASISLGNPNFLVDSLMSTYHSFKTTVSYPKIDSPIIYTKTGILQGYDGMDALGRVDTPYEEDNAELKFERFEISKGYDFHLYATEDGFVKRSGDWTFGPNDVVYISNTSTNEILRYDSTTGQFLDIFVKSDENGGLTGPKDLLFSPDGQYLYVSSFITNEILRYDGNTGKFIDKFVSADDNLSELDRPMKMMFEDNGDHLYVTSVDNNKVLKYNVDTGNIVYEITDTKLTNDHPGLRHPVSLTLDPNESLYISNTSTNEILRYDSTTGQFLDIFVKSDENGGLTGPKDLLFSPDGQYLYVSSFITNEILRYDGNTGKFIDKFVSPHNGEISDPKYMAFGHDGDLYVSSTETDTILRFNGDDGKLNDIFIDRNVGQIKSPRGLLFGPQGDLFVSNAEDSSVQRFFKNGTAKGEFVESNQSLQLNNSSLSITGNVHGLINPEGIAFFPNCLDNMSANLENFSSVSKNESDDPCYFLVSSAKNNLIFRYVYNENTESLFKDVFVGDEKIKNPQSLMFGPDGNLYVSSFDTDEILRFDGVTGEFIDVFASSGGLNGPAGMLFDDKSSSLYVSSKNSNQILRYDSRTGEFIKIFIPDDDRGVLKPESIIKGPDDNIYVSSSGTNQILKYDSNSGDLIGPFVSDKSGGLYRPKDLNFDSSGNVCVNSMVSHEIKCYSSSDGQILSTMDILFDRGLLGKQYSDFGPDGELYVSNTLSSTIARYDRNTNLFSSKILSGENEPLQGPRNLVFGPDGNIYVTSNNNHQVLRLDGKTGKFVDVFVASGSGGLSAPQDLSFHDGYLYVTSNDNHRVLRYDQVNGNFVDEFIKSRDSGLTEPRGLVFDNNGSLYVASNENHKILQYNDLTGSFERLLDTGEELQNPVGLVMDNDDNLLVSSSGNGLVISYNVKSSFLKPTVLISDEFIDDSSSLVMDAENNLLYVSNTKSNRVLVYDFETKNVNEIKALTETGYLESPYGLALQDNHLFVSNIESNIILKFNVDDYSSEIFHSGSFGVLGPLEITFGSDGNLYVISERTHEIFRYDVDSGDLLGIFSFSPFLFNDDDTIVKPSGQLQDMVFSPDGKYLHVTSMYENKILLFDGLTGKYLGVFIDVSEDGLKHPQKIVYGPDQKLLYIHSLDTGSVSTYDAQSGKLVTKDLFDGIRLDVKNMAFGPDDKLYLTVDDYSRVLYFDPSSKNLQELDLGGIYLGSLDQNLLKTKYLLNNINTTRHDTVIVYDRLLEKPFAVVSLHDDLVGDFLPLPVIWNMLSGNIGFVDGPIFKSEPIHKQSGYFKGLNDIPTIGQVQLAQTDDTVSITLETFEIRYDQNQYVSLDSQFGITKGPKIMACLTDGESDDCNDEFHNVIKLGPLLPNVGDQVYVTKNVNLQKFDTILLYDERLNEQFAEINLRDAAFFRLSPQLFIDWVQYQFPAFPLLLLGFIAFPLTFDYVRTIFKIVFCLFTFQGEKRRVNFHHFLQIRKSLL